MGLARFSRQPGEASQEGMCEQDFSSNVSSGSPRRDRAQVIRRSQTPPPPPPLAAPKTDGRERLGDVVTPDKLLPRNARTLLPGLVGVSRGEPGRAAMHDVGLVTICDTRGPSIPLFLACGLDHKQDAHAQTNMAQASSQVAPSQLPAGLRSSGVHAKLATCIALGPPGQERAGGVTLGVAPVVRAVWVV